MPTRWAWAAVVVVAIFGSGKAAADYPDSALPHLTDPSDQNINVLYQLDASNATTTQHDASGYITSWATSHGTIDGFTVGQVGSASDAMKPTYVSATEGYYSALHDVDFPAGSKLVQTGGAATTPKCVFIVENTTSTGAYGGIWGRSGVDNGIRFWEDGPQGTHHLVDNTIAGADPKMPDYGLNWFGSNGQTGHQENYYWSSTDGTYDNTSYSKTTTQTGWGVLGAYTYNNSNHTWSTTALGNYYSLGNPSSGWEGQIAEVIAYDGWLSDTDRHAVEQYLLEKWQLAPPIQGDINRDGQVGPEDFSILKDNFGASGGLASGIYWDTGDLNGDSQVGPEDFSLLKDNFGVSNGPHIPLTATPEPGCLAALLASATVLIRRHRRQ